MIVANLATYPPRSHHLPGVIDSIAPQVDRLNIVLNEYESVPSYLSEYDNVHVILPDHDTKDTGKFYPDVSDAEYVFLIDDDIAYPADYVSRTLARVRTLGHDSILGGYHCSIYERPPLRLNKRDIKSVIRFHVSPAHIARFRRFLHFGLDIHEAVFVDQIGTGAAVMRGADMPSYEYMRSSQKFVDVRLARWCFERGIKRICLPQETKWLQFEEVDDSIYHSFTRKHHRHVADEIHTFAFKDPEVGKVASGSQPVLQTPPLSQTARPIRQTA